MTDDDGADRPDVESAERAPPEDEPKSSADILSQQIRAGLNELNWPTDGLFLSGLSAGLDTGFGPLLTAVKITISAGQLPDPVTEILMANLYAVDFVFVVIDRSELFTEHTTLAVLPVLDRQASLAALGRLWGISYVANLIGGTAFAASAVYVGPALGGAIFVALLKYGHVVRGGDIGGEETGQDHVRSGGEW